MMRKLQLPILVILLWSVGLPATTEEIETDEELRILQRLVETLERQHEQQLLHKSILQSDKKVASQGRTPLPVRQWFNEDGGFRATNSTSTTPTTSIPRTTTTPKPNTGGGGWNWGWRKPWGKRGRK